MARKKQTAAERTEREVNEAVRRYGPSLEALAAVIFTGRRK